MVVDFLERFLPKRLIPTEIPEGHICQPMGRGPSDRPKLVQEMDGFSC